MTYGAIAQVGRLPCASGTTGRRWPEAAVHQALERGFDGELIDHVVLLGPPVDPVNHRKAFVLCPDGAFDRSPCGTGTGALVGCLHEDGLLAAGSTWRQESVLGGVYEASVRRAEGVLVPTVNGRAWITAEGELRFDPDDPYRTGLAR